MSRVKLAKTVVLVGMMGSGKTAVGTALAEKIGVPFQDSDDAIEQAANLSVAEIFAKFGEEFFRCKESLVLERLLRGEPCVLSTGGGAFLQAKNRDLIAATGVSLWLKADIELLWARVRHKDTRPLLLVNDPKAALRRLYDERLPAYETADLAVTADPNYSISDMAAKVYEALRAHAGTFKTQG